MERLSLEEIAALSNTQLQQRMDQLFLEAKILRYAGFYDPRFDMDPSVKLFSDTLFVRNLDPIKQRKALWMIFDFIVQLEYVSRYSGFQNQCMDTQRYDANGGWSNPSIYMAYLGQMQSSIVGSRIALERLIDLIYFVFEKRELPISGSKFSKFKEWLYDQPIESNLIYLVPYLPWMREHDVEFRTAEVHSGSRLKKYLLSMHDVPQTVANDALNLINILSNLWRYVIVLMEGQRPNGAGGLRSIDDFEWLGHYVALEFTQLEAMKVRVAETLTSDI